jgi:cyclopropane fatty-acyl-phospholipid synthase-like methyltransferase
MNALRQSVLAQAQATLEQLGTDPPEVLQDTRRRMLLTRDLLTDPNSAYGSDWFKKRKTLHKWESECGEKLVKLLHLRSVLDLGCGIGSFLAGAQKAGAQVAGCEGAYIAAKPYLVPEVANFIFEGDLTQPLQFARTYDCVLSIEVAEHLPPEFADQFVANCLNPAKRWVVISAASQSGNWHLNEQPRQYWIDKFKAKGAVYRPDIERAVRESWEKAAAWVKQNLMVFSVV